jgi:hypothetical protein
MHQPEYRLGTGVKDWAPNTAQDTKNDAIFDRSDVHG